MPKRKRTPTEINRSRSRAAIEYYITTSGMENPEVIKRLCMSEGTFYRKKQNPETYTLGELWDMAKILDCPVGDLASGILEKSGGEGQEGLSSAITALNNTLSALMAERR